MELLLGKKVAQVRYIHFTGIHLSEEYYNSASKNNKNMHYDIYMLVEYDSHSSLIIM